VRHLLPITGPLDLELTFTCGQAFRWARDGETWTGVVGRSECRVSAAGGRLAVGATGADPDAADLARYFRLEEDPSIHLEHAAELRGLPGLMPLLGLRLLRQDAWETLASFVCSAAANVRKISGCVEGMAAAWGEPIEGSTRRSFPGPEALARVSESALRRHGLGFRAPLLLATARRIADGGWDWDRLRCAPIEEARAELTALPGVGPKIADCALLFGLDRLDTYPVDRWIRRATLELAGRRRAKDAELEEWSRRFGPGRGYLQQLLFHLRRTGGPLPRLPAPRARRARAGAA
jgi:N-glycosylase/DNA lyase